MIRLRVRTTGAGASSDVDVYDTIDDYAYGGTFPTQNPGDWDQATGANWSRDQLSDDGDGVAGNGICDGGEDCVYQDRITGLLWAQADATARDWETAITHCDGLNSSDYGGYASGWRLPTQKELMQAYTDGVWSQKSAAQLNLGGHNYWSSSTLTRRESFWMMDTTYGWTVAPHTGLTSEIRKTESQRVICVR